MRLSRIALTAIAAATLTLSGCGMFGKSDKESKPANVGLTPAEAMKLHGAGSRFETSEDPAITALTHYAAGRFAESQGNPAKAVEQYQAALKLDRKHLPTLYRLGVIYTQSQAYPEAIEAWKLYIKESGEQPIAYSNLAFCYQLAGQTDLAQQTYLAGIAKDPRNNPCRVNYGLMLARAGRIDEAITQLKAVLPEPQAYYNIGSVHEQQGDKNRAREAYRKVISLDPSRMDAKARLAALD